MGISLLAASSPILQASPGLMIWTLITFFLAMVIMRKYAFRPIQKAIDDRRKVIAESVDQAERTRQEAADMLAQYQQQLQDARGEADAIVVRARKAGDELTARIKSEGEKQKQDAIAVTQQQVQAEVEKAMGELRTSVAEMTVTAAEKVLRGSIDLNQHQQLIDQAVAELDFQQLQKVGAGS